MSKKKTRSTTKRPNRNAPGSIAESIFGNIPPGVTFLDLLGFNRTAVRKVHADFTTFPPTITAIEDEGVMDGKLSRRLRKGSKS